ncbi:MAG: preprotein translocase subunit SecE [Thermoleophilaceae bacterium]|jgi:preprotein translocase SecE subunit|nr:preprotein translocase subunit SecE [Thermoleophilaceae bacterium]
MARDRQRAKQRQAERRARRLEELAAGKTPPPAITGDPVQDALLAAGAPPQDEGSTEQVVEHVTPDAPDLRTDDDDFPAHAVSATDPPAETHKRGRVIGFLIAVWAELQRVEWPDRRTTTTLTGVVLGFVLIAGGYLGLLDAVFSRLVQAIL